MIKIIDTQRTKNPDEFGETIREFAFKEEFGCYSCFDLIDEFSQLDAESFDANILRKIMGIHQENDPDGYMEEYKKNAKYYSNGIITIGWYWDGDGTLAIREGEKMAVNHDCKTNYTWEWFIR